MPGLTQSKIFPGTAQQFRAEMQRLINRCVELWGPEIFLDRRLVDLARPKQRIGLWKSSDDDLLGFREVQHLAQLPTVNSGGTASSETKSYVDVTAPTRSTWSVYMFRRTKQVNDIADIPEHRKVRATVHYHHEDSNLGTGELEASIHTVEGRKHTGRQVDFYEYTEKDEGFAGIEAYEQSNGTTQVDFRDGYDVIAAMDWGLPPDDRPIGPAFVEFCDWVIQEVWREEKEPMPTRSGTRRKRGGRPELDHDELIYRLAKAQEAEEIRRENPDMVWKEIAKVIEWNKGTSDSGVALLRDARLRLKRLKPDDPLLSEIVEWRARKTRKT